TFAPAGRDGASSHFRSAGPTMMWEPPSAHAIDAPMPKARSNATTLVIMAYPPLPILPPATGGRLELAPGKQLDRIEQVDRPEVATAGGDRVVYGVAEQLLRPPRQPAGDVRRRAQIIVVLGPQPPDDEA